MKLAKLEHVELRDVWKNEASDFTTWLAKEDNLRLLSDALDLELELVEQESKIGKFSADIVAKDVSTNKVVVIENQLEASNHDHLGKCITYASGKEADIIIWIVKTANEEHAKAVEWLNEHTDDNLAFFLVEIEALKIGDSDVAPNFKIVERPNEWALQTKREMSQVSKTNQRYLEFWTEFVAHIHQDKAFSKVFKPTKPQPQYWINFTSFASGCGVCCCCSASTNRAIVRLYISYHSPHYNTFIERYGEIEKALGIQFVCGTAKDRTYSLNYDFDIESDDWEACFKWYCETMLKLHPEMMKLVK